MTDAALIECLAERNARLIVTARKLSMMVHLKERHPVMWRRCHDEWCVAVKDAILRQGDEHDH